MKSTLPVLWLVGAAALSLMVLTGAGCGQAGATDDSKAFEGTTWRATEIAGLTTVLTARGSASTAKFDSGTVGGSGAVNSYSATYTTGPGNTIKIGAAATTEMAGPDDAMAQEAAYYAALPKAASYQVTASSLTLLDSKGKVLVKFEVVPPTPLTGAEWQATAYNNGKGGLQSLAEGSAITANFETNGALDGNAGINQYSTKYTTSGQGKMTIDAQIVSTKMAGPEAFMTQEAAYLAALPKTASYTIEGDVLQLRDPGGTAVATFVAR
jgi:heat shock protein HslJ